MPKLRGHEFYLKAKEIRPSLSDRFIFITGFTADPHMALFFNRYEVNLLGKTVFDPGADRLRAAVALPARHVTYTNRERPQNATPRETCYTVQSARRG